MLSAVCNNTPTNRTISIQWFKLENKLLFSAI
jgi:hypothetical protein